MRTWSLFSASLLTYLLLATPSAAQTTLFVSTVVADADRRAGLVATEPVQLQDALNELAALAEKPRKPMKGKVLARAANPGDAHLLLLVESAETGSSWSEAGAGAVGTVVTVSAQLVARTAGGEYRRAMTARGLQAKFAFEFLMTDVENFAAANASALVRP